DASVLPSCENINSAIELPCPVNDLMNLQFPTSQSKILRSPPPVAISLPSRENTSAEGGALCPPNPGSAFPVTASHTATCIKFPMARILLPSGENAARQIEGGLESPFAGCSFSTINSLPVDRSHNFTVSSSLPVATFLPSGEKAMELTASVCPLSVISKLPVPTSHSFAVRS